MNTNHGLMVVNSLNHKIRICDEKYYDDENESLDTVLEVKQSLSELEDGCVYTCKFKTFPTHKNRPGLVINNDAIGLHIMALGSTKEDKKWKDYPENILIKEWRIVGLEKETYANTDGLHNLKDVKVKNKIGPLTKTDYNAIITPVVKRIYEERMSKLFESADLEFLMDSIEDSL